jgi:serine protease Do
MKKQKQPILIVQGDDNWLHVENAAQNTVVQIFAQVGKFNWTEPYKVEAQYESRGTGFFINDQGYLVTNAHVINEAKTVWINIPALGRETVRVEVVGFCPDRDLALLRITPQDLERVRAILGKVPFLMLGESDTVQRTHKVLVLGYPLGQHSMKSTTGVISGREAIDSISYLQITAPINPGSSGGPLISTEGAVIGIAVAVDAEAYNVGYAIPINELKTILNELVENKLTRKAILGGQFHNTTDDHARFLGNPTPAGLYVHKVFKNSLFEKAGVIPGDMIYELAGCALDSHGEVIVPWSVEKIALFDLISRLVVGQMVNMVFYRAGVKKEVLFKFEQMPLYPIRTKYPDYEDVDREVIGGMVIMELTHNHIPYLAEISPDLLNYRKIENMYEPVIVISHILPSSYAQQLRCFVPGDIIDTINGIPVTTVAALRQVVLELAKTPFLSVKTKGQVLGVFPLKEMLADEKRLAHDFVYSLSPFVAQLLLG